MKKAAKIILISVIAVMAIATIIYIYGLRSLNNAIDEANEEAFEEWYHEEFIPDSFKSPIIEVDYNQYEKFIALALTTKAKTFSYRFSPLATSDNKTLALFVAPGDTLIKKSGNPSIIVKKKNGNQKEFSIRFYEQTEK